MSETNAATLAAYNQTIQTYIETTPHTVTGALQHWLDDAVAWVEPYHRILEIGSGFGRDADYLEQCGLRVERTDAAQGFVDLLQAAGHQAGLLNALTDKLGGPYRLILADAVFLHFTVEELRLVLAKSYAALQRPGTLAFTLKQGDGSELSTAKLALPRFYQYWQPNPLAEEIYAAGFDGWCTHVAEGWLHVIART